MAKIYQAKVCKSCPIVDEACFLHFHGGRPPCGMVAEENFSALQQIKAEIAAFINELKDHYRVCANDVKIPYVIERMQKLL